MEGMKRHPCAGAAVAVLILALFALPAFPQNALPGSVEFSVVAQPTGGRPEPALRVPVLLLSKSFAEIQKEAEGSLAPPDLDQFIDSLEVSPELRTWMKRTRTVKLTGADFMRQVKNDDIFEVPEFLNAYLARNAVDVAVGFPKPKHRESDRVKDPAKYEKQKQEYMDGIRKFMQSYPHSRDGLDLHLVHLDSGQRWARKQQEREEEGRRRALEWAHTRYLVARVETGMDGRAGFVNLPAGQYWLSTADRELAAGDVRLRWDLAVTVESGRATRLELSNYNALPRERAP